MRNMNGGVYELVLIFSAFALLHLLVMHILYIPQFWRERFTTGGMKDEFYERL